MKKLAASIALATSMVMTGVGTHQASAAKPRVPGKPVIVRIDTKRVSSKYMKLTFTVEMPSANGSPILSTTVSSHGNLKCTIKKSSRSCSIARVRTNTYYRWVAQSRNKLGTGAKSSAVNFNTSAGRWLRPGYTPNGTKYPALVSRTANTRVLQGNGTKWSKFQAIKSSGITASSVRAASLPTNNAPTVTFLTSGVVGLALPSAGGTGSGLLAVNRDGTTVDAVLSSTGQTSIRDFYAAPNNKFYVVFNTARTLYAGGPNCILAEVDADSGNPVCVDSQITSVTTTYGMYGGYVANNPIQFDQQGNIYYVGTVASSGQNPAPMMATLRKSVNGAVTSLISENAQIRDFLVLEDGNVLMSGTTTSTQTSWVRRVSPEGALAAVANGTAMFMRKFADGNVYMGFQGPGQMGVRRFLTSSRTLDPKPWISSDYGTNTEGYFSMGSLCSDRSNYNAFIGFCTSSGSVISAAFNVGNSSTVVVAGWRSGSGTSLVEYFPSVSPLSVSLKNVTLASMVGNKLILAGTTSVGVNTLSVLDLTTYQETVLIDASNEVEVYNMSYIAATNKVMFNGLRFANNSYVVGEFDLP